MAQFDVVVCELGAMGSAALHHLAQRGKRVLGIERYAPATLGETRHDIARFKLGRPSRRAQERAPQDEVD
jgi:glycine/D-amino acid oxidase-like deaminating enzyme